MLFIIKCKEKNTQYCSINKKNMDNQNIKNQISNLDNCGKCSNCKCSNSSNYDIIGTDTIKITSEVVMKKNR